jgi:uncharacterized protein YdcH (DUF465 family)
MLVPRHTEAPLLTHSSSNQPAKEIRLMEINQDELKAHLMATDESFRQLAELHAQYAEQLDAIEAKELMTLEDEAEEHRLKKLKLHLKDQMTEILSRYKTQNVA